jgi:micrococcal nuclease
VATTAGGVGRRIGRPRVGAPAAVPPGALALALALVLTGCAGVVRDDGAVAGDLPPGRDAVVRDVVDGDTLVVDDGERVRMLGIDTPETKHPSKPVQCFGREASRQTARLLPRGTRVRLVADVEPTDQYGRTLAYVVRARDGLFVNAALARDGFALPLSVPPNVTHAEEIRALAADARRAGRGLWGACDDPGGAGA